MDRPLVADVSEVLDAFSRLSVNVSSSDLREFVLNWTTAAGSDIEPWIPTDWTPRSVQIAHHNVHVDHSLYSIIIVTSTIDNNIIASTLYTHCPWIIPSTLYTHCPWIIPSTL